MCTCISGTTGVNLAEAMVAYLKSQHQKLHLVQKCKTSQQSHCPSKDNPGQEVLGDDTGCCKTLSAGAVLQFWMTQDNVSTAAQGLTGLMCHVDIYSCR